MIDNINTNEDLKGVYHMTIKKQLNTYEKGVLNCINIYVWNSDLRSSQLCIYESRG